jgi:transposase-like protein
MPFAYLDRAALKARIVARVAAGETVDDICAEAGMPCAGSIQVWRRSDPLFAGELEDARRRGGWMRRLAFDEAKAEAFLARVRAGERIRDLLDKPGMPSQRTYTYWRRTQVAFQAELWKLRGARYARHSGVTHSRYRAFDQAIADKMLVRVVRGENWRRMLETDPEMPSRVVVYRWRAEQPDWDKAMKIAFRVGRLAGAKARARAQLTAELREEITDRIVLGGSLRSVARSPDMPCAQTLYAWVARWPEFAREVARACEIREVWLNDQMIDIAIRNGPFGLAETKREAAPLQLRANQLSKRPGWKRAREGRAR